MSIPGLWERKDSNLRRQSHQIYSLARLSTSVHSRTLMQWILGPSPQFDNAVGRGMGRGSKDAWQCALQASLRVAQVELKIGGVAGEAVELDVAGGVGDQSWAGGPVAGAFDGGAVLVEECDAIVHVQVAVDRRADRDLLRVRSASSLPG